MVVVNVDNPHRKSVAMTDEKGFFFMQVPDNLDTSDLVSVITSNGTKVVRYRETSTGLRLVVDSVQKMDCAIAQK